MKFKMILARSINNVIGIKDPETGKDKLPWKIPEDIAFFREMTDGKAVVMGRITWESLPEVVRKRFGNVYVITNNPTPFSNVIGDHLDKTNGKKGAEFISTVANLIKAATAKKDKELWICGGAQIYSLFSHLCNEAYVTNVMRNLESPGVVGISPSIVKQFPNQERIVETAVSQLSPNRDLYEIVRYSK